MEMLVNYQWYWFVLLEIISTIGALAFIVVRYKIKHRTLSQLALAIFIVPLLLEAGLALLIYQQTKEITTFHIVIMVFLLYACTFGIADFKKIDRMVRIWLGKRAGEDLLTATEHAQLAREKSPHYIRQKSLRNLVIHSVIFIVAVIYMWITFGNPDFSLSLRWVTDSDRVQPLTNEVANTVLRVWLIAYSIDSILNLSYILTPITKKRI